jgi:uncharacterized protein
MKVNSTILITGATGYIGKALRKQLWESGYTIRILSTSAASDPSKGIFHWNPDKGEMDIEALSGVDCIVHLAGAGIGAGRWTEQRKKVILESRVNSTRLLFQKTVENNIPLKAFIASSAVGYYGTDKSGTVFNEQSPAGNDFLAEVCVAWEKESMAFATRGIRTVIIRTGVVMSPGSPALQKMLLPVKLGAGSPIGTGKQFVPWISLTDLCNIFSQSIENESFSGVYNAVAPQSINNRELMKTLAAVYHKPFFMPAVPAVMLRMLLGEMSMIVTEGNPVIPQRLLQEGFMFRHQQISEIF